MLGPLPAFHRVVVFACSVVACVGIGAWLAAMLPGPLLAPGGAGVGAGFGMILALLLVHDFSRPSMVQERAQRASRDHRSSGG